MNSNGLLKWLMLLMIALVVIVVIKLRSGNDTPAAPAERGTALTVEEMKALGIEGDTPRDTVATLVGQVK
ncbi:TIGR03752 family integrating conjugative element protein, partial [Pseudomonas edaphica]